MKQLSHIQLGCGLIRIGREWGFKQATIPTEQEAQSFLEQAVTLGIRFFDTAPSYGLSEERLGSFLQTLSPDVRKTLTIATKCGEHWNMKQNNTFVDHSYDALVRSIDQSLSLLGNVDILQIHKATPEVLASEEVDKALAYAKSRGIKQLGVSISDMETAKIAATRFELSVVQLPFNQQRTSLQEALELFKEQEKFIIVNRPFNMGEMVHKDEKEKSKQQLLVEAYGFVLKEDFEGVILTGTGNPTHLKENVEAFSNALSNLH